MKKRWLRIIPIPSGELNDDVISPASGSCGMSLGTRACSASDPAEDGGFGDFATRIFPPLLPPPMFSSVLPVLFGYAIGRWMFAIIGEVSEEGTLETREEAHAVIFSY